jgi:hypothetical protein
MQSKWRMGTHYNQSPDGWNGFATVAEYYNTFNAADTRAKYFHSTYCTSLETSWISSWATICSNTP